MQKPCFFTPKFEEPPRWQKFDFLTKQFLQALLDHGGVLSDFSVRHAVSCFDEYPDSSPVKTEIEEANRRARPTRSEIEEAKRQARLYFLTHSKDECSKAAKKDARHFYLPLSLNRKKALEDIYKQIDLIPIPCYNKSSLALQVEHQAYSGALGDIDFPCVNYTSEVLAQIECLWVLAELIALKGLCKNRGLSRHDRAKLNSYGYKKAYGIEKKRKNYVVRHAKIMWLCPQCGMRRLQAHEGPKGCLRCKSPRLQRLYKAAQNRIAGRE